MLNRLALPLWLMLPAAAAAQQGTITYTYSVKNGFEIPERWSDRIPSSRSGTMLLHFGPSGSLMTPPPEDRKEAAPAVVTDRPILSDRAIGMAMRMKMGSTSRSDQEELREAYVSYDEGAIVETREFMGRTFRFTGHRPAFEWRLTGEQAEHLGRLVIKATAEHEERAIEAWFTPEIPVQGGPASFGGLPGMILVLSVDGGDTKYFATEIDLEGGEEGLIRMPEDGDEVSRDEYELIVAEKLEELEKLRRRGPGGGQ
ncbi:MAG: GLPGLI family protein [Gemmatimonadetes bacterium]|nr:GLPGLI family protein [Gemmatimonadota bacterium]